MKPVNRAIIEAIKQAKEIAITVNPDDVKNRMQLSHISDRELVHKIALAVQTYIARNEK